MNKIIHKCLLDLHNDEEVSKVFHTRVPKTLGVNLTKPLTNVDKWLSQIEEGTFIDSKFDPQWLSYHGISKDLLNHLIMDMSSICNLFTLCVKDCANITDIYDSFDTFIFDPNTFRSAFLRHAVKFISKERINHYKVILHKDLFNKLIDLQDKSMKPLWPMIDSFVNWYTSNSGNIKEANYAIVHSEKYINISWILDNFISYLNNTITTISPGALKVGGAFYWSWVKEVKEQYGINLAPTSEDIGYGLLMKTMKKKSKRRVKPKEYATWSYEKKLKWDKENS